MTILSKVTSMLKKYSNSRIISMTNTEFFYLYLKEVENIDTTSMTLYEYTELVASRKLPTFEGISRAFRKARELNPQWQKCQIIKDLSVEHMKSTVGY